MLRHSHASSSNSLDRELSYWKKQLDGIPPILDLPTDRSRIRANNELIADRFCCFRSQPAK